MFKETILLAMAAFFSFLFVLAFSHYLRQNVNTKRKKVLNRLKSRFFTSAIELDEDDVLSRPFLERTVGYLAKNLISAASQVTPVKIQDKIEEKLEKTGNPRGIKAGEFIALESILAFAVVLLSYILFTSMGRSHIDASLLSMIFAVLAVYIPWFSLSAAASRRQSEIRRHLPEMMDMLVVSVEAGLAFDLALSRVVEKYRGTVASEFKKALREMNLGKPRKDALKDLAERVDLPELSSLVNAIIQSEQLGVGLADVLRLQADLIRDKRQQWIEEQAMKAPVKMLFPIVFLIFPSIFIILLGPAIIAIRRTLAGV